MAGILTKPALRQQIKQKLANMTTDERRRQSSIITKKVLASTIYQQSQRVCLYLSMDEEVSTHDILLDVFSSGKQCFIPRYTAASMEMLRIKSLEDYDSLPKTKWNIKQPETSEGREEALASGGLDLILVPGLAFTKEGQRLGRGKGYYDMYLEKCKKCNLKCLVTIGLAFEEQVVDFIPTHEHDVSVDYVFDSHN
ncbi:unnamed protein product [Orchesella dallaii]|uniref:5-formyltetrahydrofolate cyclo-ligase n=1 Tax=Orchesella dallaii TaxID=48710 RepID=A0ABP1QZA8_9HEXA